MTERSAVTRRGFLRGAAGTAALAGASGTAAAQEGGTTEIQLVDFAFEPGTDDPALVTPGTTVRFVWETNGHNINVDTKPEGSDWQGHMPIEDAGFVHEHTFETEGSYHFWCDPHKGLGMIGDIEVTEDVPTPAAAGPAIPDAAKTLGLGLFSAMLASLGLAYVLLKYGGSPAQED